MFRYFVCVLLLVTSFASTVFGQKKIFEDDFKNNKNGWRLQHDTSFLVDIKNGALHLEKFTRNFFSRGCLWYNKIIPGLDTRKDFSVTLYAKFVSGGDIVDMIDMQWGENSKREGGRITSSLYQLTFSMKGDIRLEYFKKGWTFFVRKDVKTLVGENFDPKQINKYELLQKDSVVVFKVNGKEVLKHSCPPIEGNSIGFQQCLRSAWEIDKIVVRQQDKKRPVSFDTSRTLPFINPSEIVHPSDKELKVYPNPFDHHLNVAIDLQREENIQVSLIDMHGNTLQQHNKQLPAGIQNVQLYADVPPGSYILKVQIGKRVLTATVIKQ